MWRIKIKLSQMRHSDTCHLCTARVHARHSTYGFVFIVLLWFCGHRYSIWDVIL